MLLVFNAFSVFIDLGGTQSALRLFLSFHLSPDFPLLPTPILPSRSQLFIKCNGEKTAKGTAGCCPNVQEPTGERMKKTKTFIPVVKSIKCGGCLLTLWDMFLCLDGALP